MWVLTWPSFFFFFFFYPFLTFNELSSRSHFASFTISSIHVPHVSFSRSTVFNNYFYSPLFSQKTITSTYTFYILIATHTFQYCKSQLYMALGGGDKTLKKKKETLSLILHLLHFFQTLISPFWSLLVLNGALEVSQTLRLSHVSQVCRKSQNKKFQ